MNKKINTALIIIVSLILVIGVYLHVTKTKHKEVIKIENKITPKIKDDEIVIELLKSGFKMIRPGNTSITTSEKEITFTGMVSPKEELTVNGEKVNQYFTGNFTLLEKLKDGNNKFTFSNGKKSITYNIKKTNKLILSVLPKEKMVCNSGMEITIEAKLYSGATAYAKINGEKIPLKQVETDEYIDARETSYAKFKGVYKVKDTLNSESLGKVKIYGDLDGKKETLIGGEILVNSKNQNLNKPIEINTTNANVYKANDLSYIPIENVLNLPKGTKDTIKNKVSVDNKKYYILNSGLRIKESAAKEIQSNINQNEIYDIQVNDKDNFTVFKIKEKEKNSFILKTNGVVFADEKNDNYTPNEENYSNITLEFKKCNKIPEKINMEDNKLFKDYNIENNKITFNFKEGEKVYGILSFYNTEGDLIIKFKHKLKSLKDAKIVVDPGHGLINRGYLDSGALGFNGINEHDINVACAKELKKSLEAKGAKVTLLDTTKEFYSLTGRPEIALKNESDLFISLHSNSGGSGEFNANEVYYYNSYSKDLAKCINESVVKLYEEKLFGGKASDYNRGYKWDYFTVTLEKSLPAVLVELGYVDNPASFNKLINPKYQKEFANSITSGIENYIK